MIFLTPQIVNRPHELVALTHEEKHKMSRPTSLTERELNEFLDGLPSKEDRAKYQKELDLKAKQDNQ
jgi:type II secretory pathway component GspD/PulD (secretin)